MRILKNIKEFIYLFNNKNLNYENRLEKSFEINKSIADLKRIKLYLESLVSIEVEKEYINFLFNENILNICDIFIKKLNELEQILIDKKSLDSIFIYKNKEMYEVGDIFYRLEFFINRDYDEILNILNMKYKKFENNKEYKNLNKKYSNLINTEIIKENLDLIKDSQNFRDNEFENNTKVLDINNKIK